ncbi:hypothetical protein BGZ54_007822 [Gamsiella multidivaricata]|nr:hypothetical protein BGZ54_007822 [Gamsiella multidivaricata]
MLYDNVRAVLYRSQTDQSRKALSPIRSVQLWLEQIKDEGGKSMFKEPFKDAIEAHREHYLLAWCSKFRLKVADSDMMRPGLKAIRNADSEAALQEKWNDFQRRFAHAKELIAYIKTWMEPERIYCEVEISYHGDPADEKFQEKSKGATTGNDNGYLPLESMLSDRLKLMLQKHRTEKEEAEKLAKAKVKEARQKREWEETQAQFDADLETLFDLAKKQKKKCTLLYFKGTAALLHTTAL